jgi:hypothetical protein
VIVTQFETQVPDAFHPGALAYSRPCEIAPTEAGNLGLAGLGHIMAVSEILTVHLLGTEFDPSRRQRHPAGETAIVPPVRVHRGTGSRWHLLFTLTATKLSVGFNLSGNLEGQPE